MPVRRCHLKGAVLIAKHFRRIFHFDGLVQNVDHGASYGDTLSWAPGQQPGMGEALVELQTDLDKVKFYKEFVDLLTRPTPLARPASAN